MIEEVPAKTLTNAHVNAWRLHQATLTAEERVYCVNWDDRNMVAHAIYGGAERRVIGILQPVDYELVANSPGIQPWSKV